MSKRREFLFAKQLKMLILLLPHILLIQIASAENNENATTVSQSGTTKSPIPPEEVPYICDVRDNKYIVSLRLMDNDEWKHFCAGALIHKRWVVTSASCTEAYEKTPDMLWVLAGIGNLKATIVQKIRAEEIVVHPGFNSSKFKNDISLIKLHVSFKMKNNVGVIQLPPDDYVSSIIKPIRSICASGKISGWGNCGSFLPYDKQSTHVYKTRYLLCAKVHVMDMYDCSSIELTHISSHSNICSIVYANGSNKNVLNCHVDPGGPLECNNYLMGIRTDYFFPNDVDMLTYYSNVGKFRDFIRQTIKSDTKGHYFSRLTLVFVVLMCILNQ